MTGSEDFVEAGRDVVGSIGKLGSQLPARSAENKAQDLELSRCSAR